MLSQAVMTAPTPKLAGKYAAVLFLSSGLALSSGFYLLFFHYQSVFYLYYLGVIWAVFLALFIYFPRLDASVQPREGYVVWGLILLFGLLLRVMAFSAEPYLADDYERYLFDGRIQWAGFNPYTVVPQDLKAWGGDLIPKAEVKTIYPPLAEVLFKLSAWFGNSLLSWKLFSLIPDLLGALVFARLLMLYGRSPLWVTFWLWNPLILKEISHAGHLDIWTLFAVLLFFYAVLKQRLRLAGFFLALAVLIKLIPLLIFPLWLLQLVGDRIPKKRLIEIVSVFVITLLLGFLAYFPEHPFLNIAFFYQHIQGYGALYQLGTSVLSEESVKRLLISVAGGLLLFLVIIKGRYQKQDVLALSEVFLLLFIFSSMGFPWYLLLCLPWIIIKKDWLIMALVALTQLNFYAYQLEQPAWQLVAILLLLVIYWLVTNFREVKYESKHYVEIRV